MAQTANIVNLNPRTVEAFHTYIADIEAGMRKTIGSDALFRWSETNADLSAKIAAGDIVAEFWSGKGPVKIPDGLIHDWIAAATIPNATVKRTLTLIQDYDNHKSIYRSEVIGSKLIARENNDFKIYLRLLKKKILTVVLDTDHDVHYQALKGGRWLCNSHTTRISEVENPGRADERVLPADTGFGFLWRLNSYWRFEDCDQGVYIECRAISLTRDIPAGLGWIIEPIVRKLPRESLIATLRATREGLLANVGKR